MRTVAEKLAGEAAVVQVDADDNSSLSSRFGVRGIPVVLLLRNGKEIDRIEGVRPAEALISWFRQHQ